MTAYYNEIDPLKAEVLREAIKAGAIAPGDVDERSIVEVKPADLVGYTQCHFFAGGGFWSLALRWAGWPDRRPVWTGSCPCPSFSAAGKGSGFDDPRHLWPHWARLVWERRPPVLFGEQADDAIGYGWLDLVQTDLEAAAYAVGAAVLGACSVGAPHIRQRLYFVADTADSGWLGRRTGKAVHESGAQQQSQRCSDAVSLGDTKCGGRQAVRECSSLGRTATTEKRSGNSSPTAFGDSGTSSDLGVADSDRCESRRGTIATARHRDSAHAASGESSSVGHTYSESERGHSRSERAPSSGTQTEMGQRHWQWNGPVDDRAGAAIESAGPLNGFWRDADWIGCRDGKFRPVEPGTFPLAHGSAARVGRLRMYGDGIVVTAAQAFIESYCEARGIGLMKTKEMLT